MLNYRIIRFFSTLTLCPATRQHLLESPFFNQIRRFCLHSRKNNEARIVASFSQSVSQSCNPQTPTDYLLVLRQHVKYEATTVNKKMPVSGLLLHPR